MTNRFQQGKMHGEISEMMLFTGEQNVNILISIHVELVVFTESSDGENNFGLIFQFFKLKMYPLAYIQ
jgi:hypothetical protein